MSKQQKSAPSPPPSSPKPKGPKERTLSKVEVIALIGLVLVAGYILLDRSGVKMVERSEEVIMDDRPQVRKDHKKFIKNLKKRKEEEQIYEKRAEDLLKQFIETEQQRQGRYMDEDEKAFLKKTSSKLNPESQVQDSQAFLSNMQNSYRFYKAVKGVSNGLSTTTAKSAKPPNDTDTIINDLLQLETEELQSIFSKEALPKEILDAIAGSKEDKKN